MVTKVFGHLSPDTDTTCCAILWAWHLNSQGESAEPYVLGALNKETQFVLDHWKVAHPPLLESVAAGDDVAIVDTNNPQELFSNINEANILWIVDHHKLVGGLTSASPMSITLRPLASTASVICDLMGDDRDKMPQEMAGLMLSCILSDTLEFRSPTTTPHDKEIAQALAEKLGVNIPEYAAQMFKAKSDVSEYSDDALIKLDAKKFAVGDKNILVSALETTDPASVLSRIEGLKSAMTKMAGQEGIDDVLLFVIDILKEEATVVTYNELTKQVIKASFGADVSGDTLVLPGVVSRKKQIVPVLKL